MQSPQWPFRAKQTNDLTLMCLTPILAEVKIKLDFFTSDEAQRRTVMGVRHDYWHTSTGATTQIGIDQRSLSRAASVQHALLYRSSDCLPEREQSPAGIS